MAPRQPTTNEARKALDAAGVPEGEGFATSDVLRGLREVRPPASVLVGVGIMAVLPLGLLALAGYIAVSIVTSDSAWWVNVLRFIPGVGLPFVLSALSYRGVKRALHTGDYQAGFFTARLVTGLCTVIAVFLVYYLYGRGKPYDPTMAYPFVVLALAWLPGIPLALPSARRWPDRVFLRRGAEVRGELEAQMFMEARQHICGTELPAPLRRLLPTADDSGPGWRVDATCPTCGQPLTFFFRHRRELAPPPDAPLALGAPGSRSPGLGGGDWMHLALHFDAGTSAPQEQLTDEELHRAHARAVLAEQATEELLALVPAGKKAVPLMRRSGRPVPFGQPLDEFGRATLERRLADRRDARTRLQEEIARRAAAR